MGKFFNELVDAQLMERWADTLDWIFDDNKFSPDMGWTSGKIGAFTKGVKNLFNVSDEKYFYESLKNISFPNPNSKFPCPMFYMSKEDSEGKGIVRHIRNGIAHGRTQIYKVGRELYIEICDYKQKKNKNGKAKKISIQTAYITIPLSYIPDIYEIYCRQECDMRNDRKFEKKCS